MSFRRFSPVCQNRARGSVRRARGPRAGCSACQRARLLRKPALLDECVGVTVARYPFLTLAPRFAGRARGGVYLPCGSAAHCRRWCGLAQARSAERDGFQVPQAHESTGQAIRKTGGDVERPIRAPPPLLIRSQGEPSTIMSAQQPARSHRAASGARPSESGSKRREESARRHPPRVPDVLVGAEREQEDLSRSQGLLITSASETVVAFARTHTTS